MTKEEMIAKTIEVLAEEFEVETEVITPEADIKKSFTGTCRSFLFSCLPYDLWTGQFSGSNYDLYHNCIVPL